MSDDVLELIIFLYSSDHDLKMSLFLSPAGLQNKYYNSPTQISIASGYGASG